MTFRFFVSHSSGAEFFLLLVAILAAVIAYRLVVEIAPDVWAAAKKGAGRPDGPTTGEGSTASVEAEEQGDGVVQTHKSKGL